VGDDKRLLGANYPDRSSVVWKMHPLNDDR